MTTPTKFQFLAGTALCLMMSVPLSARAGEASSGMSGMPANGMDALILAQAEDPNAGSGAEGEADGDCPPGSEPGNGGCVVLDDAPPEEQQPSEPEAEAPPPSAEPEGQTPRPEARPVEPGAESPQEEAPQVAPQEAPADTAPQGEGQPQQEQTPADGGEEQDADPGNGAAQNGETPQDEAAPAEQAQEAEEEPGPEEAPADSGEEQDSGEEDLSVTPQDEAPATTECPPGMEMSGAGECIPAQDEEAAPQDGEATDETPAEEAPAAEDAAPDEAAPEEGAPEAEEQPAEEGQAPSESAPEEVTPEDQPGQDEQAPEDAPEGESDADLQVDPDADVETDTGADVVTEPGAEEAAEEEVPPENAAPVLDSQKEEGAAEAEQPAEDQAGEPEEGADEPAQEQAEDAPMPESDSQAQQELVDPEQMREEIRSIVQEEGQRIELGQTPEDQQVRRARLFERREGARVIEEYNDNRTIIEINNEVYVESSDYDRFVGRGDQVYYEELRGGRVREVIERGDGTRVVTVRNRYGDVVRRVRVMPDGREYVLAYVPDNRYDAVMRFEDPGRDLPPLRLTIPVSEYILEAEAIQQPDRYYEFLSQPPVEPVSRLYSLEEVKYSARVRDMVRRIDLDTIEFEFGSARIEESEIADLEALANAMLQMLEESPAETFLIEGHTDAVGSEMANLALSDQRAEAVARALTNAFGIPPENLVTQGYGEQYLKVNTQERARENRRVAVRRITPLVTPVASNQ